MIPATPADLNDTLLLLLQGLPATLTSLLSLTALRLKERNVLIKRTDIIENLVSGLQTFTIQTSLLPSGIEAVVP